MDKNKAIYKLKGLPPIYYLNLDEQPERAQYMEGQFKYWEIQDYTRISAYDGRDGRDLGDILKGRYPDNMSSGEVGCVTSHLKALKHFLENSDSSCALIMEDDCDISTVTHWPFNWKDFFCKVPYDYDVVQLAIINPAQVHVKMHRRFVNDFSTACYLITRHHAQKLISLHVRGISISWIMESNHVPLLMTSYIILVIHSQFLCSFIRLNWVLLFITIM
jgi:GR25 family glycosyltransferase involved in LPS biosynthesis